ncbi:Extracellular protease inhibitor 10 [Bulinus truncatus]|nr:Extracellular protease inhibitor 10 [Bulinus truncatus]
MILKSCCYILTVFTYFCSGQGSNDVPPPTDCRPDLNCPEVYQPVCATDGNTYSNACYMEKQTCGQVQVNYTGQCGNPSAPSDTGPSSSDVAPKECKPDFNCLDVYQPVCGTDGKTYSNGCYMELQSCGRVQVNYTGQCGNPSGPSEI